MEHYIREKDGKKWRLTESSSSFSDSIAIGCQLSERFHSRAVFFGGKRPAKTVAIDTLVRVTPVVCACNNYNIQQWSTSNHCMNFVIFEKVVKQF